MNVLAIATRFPLSGARGSRRWLALLLGLFLALASPLDAIPTRGAADYLEIPRGIATRTWSGGKVQALTWDPRGRLVKVVQTGVEPFVWTALYDGLDRRIQTTYTPQGGATVVTKSVFDPEVEFLEIGLTTEGTEDTEVSWKVYGPDLSGRYGGLQGLGGLEAIIGSDGVTRGMVSDWFGNTVGHVAAPGGAMSWSAAQFLAWGAAPGWSTPPQDGTKPLHELLGYRGLTVDPTGYVQQGLRAYDPQVGRWLSPDPVGHAGSLSLYDYCDNDPLNVFDPDGRFGKGVVSSSVGVHTSIAGFAGSTLGISSLSNYSTNVNYMANKALYEAPSFSVGARTMAGISVSIASGNIFDSYRTPQDFPGGVPRNFSINGIWTDEGHAFRMSALVANHLHVNTSQVVSIQNNTRFGGRGDIARVIGQQFGAIDITALRTAEMINASGGGNVVAHSNGTAVFGAAMNYVSSSVRSNISFQGFGGQWHIDQKQYGLASAMNVRHVLDPVPLFSMGNWDTEDGPKSYVEVGDGYNAGFSFHDFNKYYAPQIIPAR